VKDKIIVRKFNNKCFINNKVGYLAKDCKNKGKLRKPAKRSITSLLKFQK